MSKVLLESVESDKMRIFTWERFLLRTFIVGTIVFAGIIGFTRLGIVSPRSLSSQVGELLRSRIEVAGTPAKIAIGEETVYASVVLPLFYERRTYRPAWSSDKGPLPQTETLLKAISEAETEGLNPRNYHLERINTTLREIRDNQIKKRPLNPGRLVDLDLLLTDAFLIYGSHLLAGRINPVTLDPEWHASRREVDLAKLLESALDRNSIEEALKGLLPPYSGYAKLKEALTRYRDIALQGGWPTIPPGSPMRKGAEGQPVAALCTRLGVTGDLEQKLPEEHNLFDEVVDQAVRRFQRRHEMEVDGVVGPATLAALNVSADERVHQIELNLERWRWLPQNLGKSHVLVNIANFELEVVETGLAVITMRVVVGRPYRRTPVFSDQITYLVLSPYWHIPPGIAVKDILPHIRKDPEYLTRQDIKVFRGWGGERKEVDPKRIHWSKVGAKNFPYRFRQDPGPDNVLGQVKFMFPNKFNVYLHDTPARELFTKTVRGFSSGCIRIEKPIELAEYLLRADPKWTRETLLATIEKRAEQTVRLSQPVPVHLLYWTVWIDEDKLVQFRSDIYGRDILLDRVLRERPPRP